MRLIDRTILEMVNSKCQLTGSDNKLIEFCSLLKTLGISEIEVNPEVLSLAEHFGEKFIYDLRLGTSEDIKYIEDFNVNTVIIEKDNCEMPALIQYLLDNTKTKIILEIKAHTFKEADKFLKSKQAELLHDIYGLRITGLTGALPIYFKEYISNIKETYNVNVDICAQDDAYCGTAIATEAIHEGVDSVTATFSGFGSVNSYAAVEEIIMAQKVVYKTEFSGDTTVLQIMKKVFEQLTQQKIKKDKPIIGSDIFLCESGVHVDGIIKNPKNYEPFEPELVGLRRQIVLGKHSGPNALEVVLKQNNIKYEISDLPSILKKVQEKSVEIKSYFDVEALRKLVLEYSLCS